MPPISVLIKPASGLCNLRCIYCFYCDEMKKREIPDYGIMSTDTIDRIVKKTLEKAEGYCAFAFQGGEPTLAGISFYQTFIKLLKEYNTNNIKVGLSLQTNGYVIDEQWAGFFAANGFLIGLSLDGIEYTHDRCRVNSRQEGSFHSVMETAFLFDKFHVEYNILTVINRYTAKKIRQIYSFYKDNKFMYQQYIACLDPLGEPPGKQHYSLTSNSYGHFLMDLFDLWYEDLKAGKQPYIRSFDNYIAILCGHQPEACDMRGSCGLQYVVEADGSVYPCDFYVFDDKRLGNIWTDDYETMDIRRKQIGFVEESEVQMKKCLQCPYVKLCKGGCKRNRMLNSKGEYENYFCESYTMFFKHALKRMQEIAYTVYR